MFEKKAPGIYYNSAPVIGPEGTVIGKDTKEPIPNAWVGVASRDFPQTGDVQLFCVWVKADQRGRFRARCRAAKWLTIYVYPPAGVPYPARAPPPI